jgi:CBS domain-containing protein
MQLSDILTHQVETIPPTASIKEAAQRMRSMDVGALPVCDGQRLLGMVTDRDLTIRMMAEGRDPVATPVSEAMTPDVRYCFADQDVKEAARIMQQEQIRRLPVVDRQKHLVGIVSLGDLAVAGDDRLSGDTLQDISQPSHGNAEATARRNPQMH